MKNFENEKKLAEMLANYAEIKNEEKQQKAIEAEKLQKVLASHTDTQVHSYNTILKELDDVKKENSELKKIATANTADAKAVVDQIISDMISEGEEENNSISFTGIGSVNYSSQLVPEFTGTSEDKENLINDIIQLGRYDLLDLNMNNLGVFSEEMRKSSGEGIENVLVSRKIKSILKT